MQAAVKAQNGLAVHGRVKRVAYRGDHHPHGNQKPKNEPGRATPGGLRGLGNPKGVDECRGKGF